MNIEKLQSSPSGEIRRLQAALEVNAVALDAALSQRESPERNELVKKLNAESDFLNKGLEELLKPPVNVDSANRLIDRLSALEGMGGSLSKDDKEELTNKLSDTYVVSKSFNEVPKELVDAIGYLETIAMRNKIDIYAIKIKVGILTDAEKQAKYRIPGSQQGNMTLQ